MDCRNALKISGYSYGICSNCVPSMDFSEGVDVGFKVDVGVRDLANWFCSRCWCWWLNWIYTCWRLVVFLVGCGVGVWVAAVFELVVGDSVGFFVDAGARFELVEVNIYTMYWAKEVVSTVHKLSYIPFSKLLIAYHI